jgi:asparagine synthase (glutamine-hydrolysing)
MQRHASKPVNTYTIGFREKGFDEATYAADIARHLQTNHTEIYMSTTDVLDLVPRVPEVFDEPFGDSSQLPTILVSSVARRYVTVALSGDGGDEIFGGYRRYQRFWQLWRWLSVLPAPMRRYVGRAAELAARVPMEAIWRIFGCLVPGDAGRVTIPQQLAKIGQFAQLNGVDALYERQLTHWDNPSRVVESSAPPWWQCGGTDPGNRASAAECFERMMELDLGHYLPDDILVKVDRATMHVGLESRAPLLDHRVIEFAARLPVEMRIRPGHGKRVLRELAGSLVPASLIERPKQGFGVPLARWLRGPLREWADESLAKPQLARSGIIDPEPVAQLWHEHQNGHRDWAAQLWDVLMFQSWYAHHVGNRRWPARG